MTVFDLWKTDLSSGRPLTHIISSRVHASNGNIQRKTFREPANKKQNHERTYPSKAVVSVRDYTFAVRDTDFDIFNRNM